MSKYIDFMIFCSFIEHNISVGMYYTVLQAHI